MMKSDSPIEAVGLSQSAMAELARFKDRISFRPFSRPGSRAANDLLSRLPPIAKVVFLPAENPEPEIAAASGRTGWMCFCSLTFALHDWLVYQEFLCGILDSGERLSESQCTRILGLRQQIVGSEALNLMPKPSPFSCADLPKITGPVSGEIAGLAAKLDQAIKSQAESIFCKHFDDAVARVDESTKTDEIEKQLDVLRKERGLVRRNRMTASGPLVESGASRRLAEIDASIADYRQALASAQAHREGLKKALLASGADVQLVLDRSLVISKAIRWEIGEK